MCWHEIRTSFREASPSACAGSPPSTTSSWRCSTTAGTTASRLYILIDEYDNFANTILAERGADAYHSFTHGGGFYRSFFATLKAGAERDSVDRLFITGVSPVTMDDVTSGFNIGANISLLPEFNELLGFTEAEVRWMLEMYRERRVFNQDVDETLGLMREWYNGYRFAEDAENAVYNTDMVLFYLNHSLPNKRGPRRLIDNNVRIDYTKLRHLLLTEQRLNGNFDLLGEAVGEARIDCELAESFPLAELAQRENFLTLMHCFGLLSIQGADGGVASLGIPNPDRAPAALRPPARRLPRRGRVPAGLPGARPADAPHGAARRVGVRSSTRSCRRCASTPAFATICTARKWCRASSPRT